MYSCIDYIQHTYSLDMHISVDILKIYVCICYTYIEMYVNADLEAIFKRKN